MEDYRSKQQESDDEIVLEGILTYKKVILILAVIYAIAILATFGLALLVLPCLLTANCLCLGNWRVYITHNEIWNNRGCGFTVTPFPEIAQISVISSTLYVQVKKKDGTSFRLHLKNCEEFVAAVKNEITCNQQRAEYLAHAQMLKQTHRQFKFS